MHKYAIKVDLTNFFTDERKYALILVNPDWENVAVLQRRVEAIFELSNINFLTEDEYFVPAQEPIDILLSAKSLKAFVPKNKKLFASVTLPSVEETKKIRKQKTLALDHELATSTPQQERFKRKKSPEITSTNEITCDVSFIKENKKKKKKSEYNDEPKSPKRKEILKSPDAQSVPNVHLRFCDAEVGQESSKVGCDITDLSNNTSELNKSDSAKIIFRCVLMHLSSEESRSISLQSKRVSSVEILENITLLPPVAALDIENSVNIEPTVTALESSAAEKKKIDYTNTSLNSETCSERSVILLEDSKVEDATNMEEKSFASEDETSEMNDVVGANSQLNKESNEIEQLLAKSKPLVKLPNLGEVLLFKLSLASRTTGKPAEFTQYIVGRCEYVNRRSKSITISLISYPSGAEITLNKFSSHMDNSRVEIEKISTKFSELIDPMMLQD